MDVKLLQEEFEAVLERDPKDRGPYLEMLRRRAPDLSAKVTRLLDNLSPADAVFETTVLKDSPLSRYMQAPEALTGPHIPDRIGAYTILDRLGGGGMGEVYHALMEYPVSREVALKLVKPGNHNQELLQRLKVERQALVQLNHNHVVRVFDVGATTQGRPWFTMEYFKDAETITAWCDREKVGIRGRIELFMQMCDGVIHAHDRGFIHGDLKPTNILVTMQDGAPVVKIIDFGTVRSVEPEGDGAMGSEDKVFGAPAYISPEQTLRDGGATTRSDLYTAGVVLYELLTGSPLADPEGFPKAADHDKLAQIRERVHPTASSRYAAEGSKPDDAAGKRNLTPAEARKALSGDLDWILARALRKNPDERYGGIRELKADLECYLTDLPVTAAPRDWRYRAGKFVRRRRVHVALSAAALFSLLVVMGSFAAVLVSKQEALVNELKRQKDFNRLIELVFEQSNTYRGGAGVTLFQAVYNILPLIKDGFIEDPHIAAPFLISTGQSARGNGEFHDALAMFSQVRDLYLEKSPEKVTDIVRVWVLLGLTQANLNQYEASEQSLSKAMTMVEDLQTSDAAYARFRIHAVWSNLCRIRGQKNGAETHFHQAITEIEKIDQHDEALQQKVKVHLAKLLVFNGEHDKGIAIYKQVLKYRESTFGPDDMMTMDIKSSLADALLKTKKQPETREAVRYLEEILPQIQQKSLDRNPQILRIQARLAQAYDRQGSRERALAMINNSIKNFRELLGPNNPQLLSAQVTQAEIIGKTDSSQAVDLLYQTIRYYETSSLDPSDPDVLRARNNLCHHLIEIGRAEEALPQLQRVYDLKLKTRGPNAHKTLLTLANIAAAYHVMGRFEKSAGKYKDVIKSYEAEYTTTGPMALSYRMAYTECLIDMRRFKSAEEQIQLMQDRFGNGDKAGDIKALADKLEAARERIL